MVSPHSAGVIMPRQIILSALEREALLASPVNRDELIRWYTFSEPDVALIRQRRGDAMIRVQVFLCGLTSAQVANHPFRTVWG